MSTTLAITVLAENRTTRRGLIAEHGLALWIEAGSRCILFDTGQGLALAHNPKLMGIDLTAAADVVLSHGHYDHAGGLDTVLARVPHIRLYAHPEAFRERYERQPDGRVEPVGASVPPDLDTRVMFHPVTSPTQLGPDILLTGEVPRRTVFEDVGGVFYCDRACTRADQLPDDLAMAVDTPRGTVVVLGCGHAGLVNTLEYVRYLTAERPIYAVVGGMHLANASADRVEQTIAALRRHEVEVIAPLHCTGLRPTAAILEAFPDRFLELRVGMRHDFA
ncbi:MAG TPA: MBL fold metallo-hydrolase [Phycisphaerae bacterium]|nr:MBL fold metallo-hydrolase [Phycisphaerae bacterium]HOJ72523.1 MBL fold metallo-hydrolase [Phycisphaerae bacterium]HOM49816.1 MBL fold metallo-hydrolase [Phycisphaerae bacterium]HON67765.1 MBL fold metallo-hydrolase [Phycisphaerae bacterium]HOQ84262.1 MBL fold metallo-hydrolase [Phycisphaerae bacterium]